MTWKSGRIGRIWPEMAQKLRPASTKVAQVDLQGCNSAKFWWQFRQKIRQKIRQLSPKFTKFRQISTKMPNVVAQKGCNFEHLTCENFCPLQGSSGPFRPKAAKRIRNQSLRPLGTKSPKLKKKKSKATIFVIPE